MIFFAEANGHLESNFDKTFPKIVRGLPALFLSSQDVPPSLKRGNHPFTVGRNRARSAGAKYVGVNCLAPLFLQPEKFDDEALLPFIHQFILTSCRLNCYKKRPVLTDCPVCLRLANINIEKKWCCIQHLYFLP
jgi:hypothetical protein